MSEKTPVSEMLTVLTDICILYWLCLVTVHKDLSCQLVVV